MVNKNSIIISHPTGNANTRSAIYGLQRNGLLFKYVTTIAVFTTGIWHSLSQLKGLKTLTRKAYADEIKERTECHPFKELGRQLFQKIGWKRPLRHETGLFCVDKEYEAIDKAAAELLSKNKDHVDAVYCYDDGAIHTFRRAKELGKVCLFDLPIGHWRTMLRLLDEERKNRPEWASTMVGFDDSSEKLQRKDVELSLADRIYVASTFTKKTLEDFPGALSPIEVIPYGFPDPNMERTYKPLEGRKVRLLYVGGLTQRKGLSYVFEAAQGLEDIVELTVVGAGNIGKCNALKEALTHVNYIPTLAHDDVLKLMAESDVLLFPSLFEGFGLVITEAMSQGTPVITTDRTCGLDLIDNGKNGWIVEAGTAAPIKALLRQFIANPGVLQEVGIAARETARLRPWRRYEDELAASVESFLNGELS